MAGIVKILDLNGLSYLYTKLRNEIDDFQATSKSVIDEAASRANTAADRADSILVSVDDTFLNKDDAASTYLTQSDAGSTYQTKSDTESLYLKKADASSTYQTKSDADTNYLKKSDAGDTYLSRTDAAGTYLDKDDAASTYLTQTNASSTYQTKSDTSSNYLKKTDAASTYLSATDASSTYQTKSDTSSNYLKKTDASNTYATKQALNDAIAGVTSISYSVVSSLPSTGSDGVIYLVPKTSTENNNSYYEYIWIKSTSKFEKIGDTTVDLSGYLKSDTAASTYLSKTDASNTYLSKNDASSTYATKTSIPTKVSQLTNDSGYKTTDNNTTYSLTQDSKDGHKLTFAGSDGTSKTFTIPDNNTKYSTATKSDAGLMSASDKSKLDGIASGANAYTLPTATSSALGGVKVGNNITNSSGTISLTKANVTAALGYTPPTKDTDTHYASTTIVNNSSTATANTTAALTNGNVYLNHIENGAVKSSHKISGSGATSVTTDTSGNITISSKNTTYPAATQSANGLMSAADKKKLDGITISNYLTKTDASNTYLGKSANAASATKLATARTIAISGAVSGSASFDGTGNITINTTVQAGTSAPSSLANGAIYCVYEE